MVVAAHLQNALEMAARNIENSFHSAYFFLASSDGFYTDVIIVYALERIELLYGFVGFVIHESSVIAIQDHPLENLYSDINRHLLEDLDVVDIVEELRENIESELKCTVNFVIVVYADIDV